MATTYNLPTAISGDSYSGVRWTVSVNGSALDLSGGSVVLSFLAGGVNQVFSTDNGKMEIISGSVGIVEFSPQIINVNAYGTFPYKVVFYLADGDVHTYIVGNFEILLEPRDGV